MTDEDLELMHKDIRVYGMVVTKDGKRVDPRNCLRPPFKDAREALEEVETISLNPPKWVSD